MFQRQNYFTLTMQFSRNHKKSYLPNMTFILHIKQTWMKISLLNFTIACGEEFEKMSALKFLLSVSVVERKNRFKWMALDDADEVYVKFLASTGHYNLENCHRQTFFHWFYVSCKTFNPINERFKILITFLHSLPLCYHRRLRRRLGC